MNEKLKTFLGGALAFLLGIVAFLVGRGTKRSRSTEDTDRSRELREIHKRVRATVASVAGGIEQSQSEAKRVGDAAKESADILREAIKKSRLESDKD